jgi:DNA-binding transcriptional regulator/RsmH inhibitor MraZ
MTTTTTELTTLPAQVLKTDCKGRIRFPAKMREELLDRFERSGMSVTGHVNIVSDSQIDIVK